MSGSPAEPPARTVLLLEDNHVDIFVIGEVLKACGPGLRLRTVRDGAEALLYLQNVDRDESSECPALILLDLNVPKVDGIEVLRRFRHGSRCQNTPVIIVTSSMAEPERVAARQLGAAAYFQKPGDLSAYMELARVIRRVLHLPDEDNLS